MCTVIEFLPLPIDQMCKSCTSTMSLGPFSLSAHISSDSYLTLNSSGVPSIKIFKQRFVIGIVVTTTKIAKIYVHIGSTNQALGSK